MNDLIEVSCLDKGYVRLVDFMGGDTSITDAARVSYNKDKTDSSVEKNKKLIQYMIANRHTSPFEHVVFTFEIKCPIFVARQWMRHRTWSYNEISGRYSVLQEEYYIPQLHDITLQDEKNKQARTEEKHPDAEYIQHAINTYCNNSFKAYEHLLALKCPRELARMVLPLNTYTRFFGTVNLHNLIHFLHLRLDSHSQYEIRVYAEAIKAMITPIVPLTMEAYNV
jgi:thymidylate synthase (FAD)